MDVGRVWVCCVFVCFFVFFFFKRKTAYEVGLILVGSEMVIRDRDRGMGRKFP